MAFHFTKDQLLMHKIWRKALREGRLEVELPSQSDAVRLRFSLYNAVRPIRQGKAVDEELLQAAEECAVTLQDCMIVVQLKTSTSTMQAVLEALGEDAESLVEAPKTAEEVAVAESMKRVQELLDAPQGDTPRVTPYYTR